MSLEVHLVNGYNLPAKDVNGKSDPYVKFQLGMSSAKSRVIKKNLNPYWNQKFVFQVLNPHAQVLNVTLYDHDKFGIDDKIGYAVVPISGLVMGQPKTVQINLKGKSSWKFKKVRGSLTLNLKAIGFGMKKMMKVPLVNPMMNPMVQQQNMMQQQMLQQQQFQKQQMLMQQQAQMQQQKMQMQQQQMLQQQQMMQQQKMLQQQKMQMQMQQQKMMQQQMMNQQNMMNPMMNQQNMNPSVPNMNPNMMNPNMMNQNNYGNGFM